MSAFCNRVCCSCISFSKPTKPSGRVLGSWVCVARIPSESSESAITPEHDNDLMTTRNQLWKTVGTIVPVTISTMVMLFVRSFSAFRVCRDPGYGCLFLNSTLSTQDQLYQLTVSWFFLDTDIGKSESFEFTVRQKVEQEFSPSDALLAIHVSPTEWEMSLDPMQFRGSDLSLVRKVVLCCLVFQ